MKNISLHWLQGIFETAPKCAKKYLMKLIAFFKRNTDMPFIVKKKVMDAAFMSAIMYGCESWLGVCVKDMDKIYHAAPGSFLRMG